MRGRAHLGKGAVGGLCAPPLKSEPGGFAPPGPPAGYLETDEGSLRK